MLPIRFKPYVGKDYDKQDFKILTLGESHYFGEDDLRDYENGTKRIEHITNKVVNEYLDYLKTGKGFVVWMNTFTKYGHVFVEERSKKDLLKVWESISFYNYVQVPTPGPRIPPPNKDFKDSIEAFKKVVKDLKPDLILFWGDRLWDNFPQEYLKSITKGGKQIHYLKLSYEMPILILKHPSSRVFNIQNTKEKINNYRRAL